MAAVMTGSLYLPVHGDLYQKPVGSSALDLGLTEEDSGAKGIVSNLISCNFETEENSQFFSNQTWMNRVENTSEIGGNGDWVGANNARNQIKFTMPTGNNNLFNGGLLTYQWSLNVTNIEGAIGDDASNGLRFGTYGAGLKEGWLVYFMAHKNEDGSYDATKTDVYLRGATTILAATVPANEWHTYSAEINYSKYKVMLYMDGKYLAGPVSFKTPNSGGTPATTALVANSEKKSLRYYIDDIYFGQSLRTGRSEYADSSNPRYTYSELYYQAKDLLSQIKADGVENYPAAAYAAFVNKLNETDLITSAKNNPYATDAEVRAEMNVLKAVYDTIAGGVVSPSVTEINFFKTDGTTPLYKSDLNFGNNIIVKAKVDDITALSENNRLIIAIYKNNELIQVDISSPQSESTSSEQNFESTITLNEKVNSQCNVKATIWNMVSMKPISALKELPEASEPKPTSTPTPTVTPTVPPTATPTPTPGTSSVADIIVDNSDAGFTRNGTGWLSSDSTAGFYGKNYLRTAADDEAWAMWTPEVEQSGMYHVYMMFPADGKRAEQVPLEIAYDGGVDTSKTINQQFFRGEWIRLGTYPFKAGKEGYIKILANYRNKIEKDSTNTLADSIKLECADKPLDYSDFSVETTFENAGIYIPYDEEGATCEILYREKGQSKWLKTIDAIYETRLPRMFRNSIVNLKENTEYEISVTIRKDGETVKSFEAGFRTRNSNPTISRTIQIKDIYSGGAITLDGKKYSGTENGWTKIVGDGKTVIDGAELAENAMTLKNCKYIIFENLLVKGGIKNAINIDSTNSEVHFINCEITGWGRIGTLGEGGQYLDDDGTAINNDAAFKITGAKNLLIERCYAHDPRGTANNWHILGGDKSVHPKGPNAIYVGSAPGTVVRYNDFIGSDLHRWNDSIEGANNGSYNGSFYRDADIYGNMLAYGNDDSIELDGGQMNMRFYRNRIEGFFTGMSLTPNVLGPCYVYENIVTNLGDLIGAVKGGVKSGGGNIYYSRGRQFLFNNTFYVENGGYSLAKNGYGLHSLSYPNGGESYNATTRNNIIITTDERARAIYSNSNNVTPTDDFDYDLLCNTAADDKKGILSCAAPSTQELNAVYGEPTFVDMAGGNYNLAKGSLGVDQGCIIPNFKETYNGNAPDMGAAENSDAFFPFRPIDLKASAYQVELKGNEAKTITVYGGANDTHFTIRKNDAFEFLNVTTQDAKTEGIIPANGEITLNISAEPEKITQETGKAIFLIRLDDGFSIPVTVKANK